MGDVITADNWDLWLAAFSIVWAYIEGFGWMLNSCEPYPYDDEL